MADDEVYVRAKVMGSQIVCPHCGCVAAFIVRNSLSDDAAERKRRDALLENASVPIPMDKLSTRTGWVLQSDNIQTIGQLCHKTEAELLRLPNFGRKSLAELKEFLNGLGLTLGMDSNG